MSKKTGWVIAATEGATVDGRTITAAWIKDMAELYSTDEYTALIWPEHFRSSWGPFDGKNWGTVDEVKAAKQNGKLRLFVKITANDLLLAANKEGQKLFMSIEPAPDYAGSGRCYLMGLAVTDSPASTGTTRLKFSIGDKEHAREYSAMEQLSVDDFITETAPVEQPPAADSQETKVRGLLRQLFALAGLGAKQTIETPPAEEESDSMTKEQYEALMGKIDGFSAKLDEVEAKVNQFSQSGADTGEQGDEEVNSPTNNTVTAEQFNALQDELKQFKKQVAEMGKEVPNQEPDPTGSEKYSLV